MDIELTVKKNNLPLVHIYSMKNDLFLGYLSDRFEINQLQFIFFSKMILIDHKNAAFGRSDLFFNLFKKCESCSVKHDWYSISTAGGFTNWSQITKKKNSTTP